LKVFRETRACAQREIAGGEKESGPHFVRMGPDVKKEEGVTYPISRWGKMKTGKLRKTFEKHNDYGKSHRVRGRKNQKMFKLLR